MNEISTLKITGHLEIILTDALGNIKDKRSVPNLVVTAGKNLIAERLLTATPTPAADFAIMSHMALGTSGTAAADANIALGAQLGARQPLSPAATRLNNVITYRCTFGAGVPTTVPANSPASIQEAGIFNGLTAGTMLCRTTFGVITKGPNDILTINWNVTIN